MKVIIVGGVAGGATAAARLRRLDESAEIVMIERTGYVSYANCGLPYYVGGIIEDKARLAVQTPQSLARRFRIDSRVGQEVTCIDRDRHVVTVRDMATGETYEEPYDKLILSPGARAVRPDIPGIDHERVFALKTVEDALSLRDAVDGLSQDEKDLSAVVLGGGFIGLEAAENLAERGARVTVVQLDPTVMKTLDPDIARMVQAELVANGIDLRTGVAAAAIEEGRQGLVVRLTNGAAVDAGLVVAAVGVAPESDLARDAGLELGVRGSIVVDSRMRTSDPDIYATGDAVQSRLLGSGSPANVALAGPANKQGRIAADDICGIPHKYAGAQGTSVMKVFSKTVASTGLTSAAARAEGLDFDAVVLTPPSHATYYPGATNITLKVLSERSSARIIGAQAFGADGVDKRIDVLATAIRAGMTAYDLADLDLAYAPPYSSAKDPVNMAGFMIQDLEEGLVSQASWEEALRVQAVDATSSQAPVLLDVRTDAERARGGIPGSVHIPLDDLRDHMGELERGRTYYVYCQSGLRSYVACRMLAQSGVECKNVSGGFGFYSSAVVEGAGSCGVVA